MLKITKKIGNHATRRAQTFWVFGLNVGKLQLKTVIIQVAPSQVVQTKSWRTVAKSSTKNTDVPLRRRLAG